MIMDMTSDSLHTIGVVGAGAMGSGIAQVGLTAGLKVILFDLDQQALANTREQILSRIARMVEKGRIAAEMIDSAAGNLQLAADLSALAPAQVVIEAVVERLDVKQALFADLEKVVSDSAILATNTSSLSVAAIARTCQHRHRVCGMHFFNPVPLMKLVEIIGTADTSDSTLQTAQTVASRFDKTAVTVQDVPGFLVNLLGRAYTTEALHVRLENVASEADIDEIMREAAGFRMGPFELMDLTGIDVNFPATRFIYQGFQQDPRLKTTILHEALYNAGRYGRKTGRGFHSYEQQDSAGPVVVDVDCESEVTVFAAEPVAGFEALQAAGLSSTGRDHADAVLVSPQGEDAASACVRLGLEPERVVAIDCLGIDNQFVTLMAPIGGNGVVHQLAAQLRKLGFRVVVIKDSPGFVAPRLLCMIANLGCEVAQIGVADCPQDIDVAMKLAQNYPRGPLEWAEYLGLDRVLSTMQQMQTVSGSDRYRPSLWLRRRALLKRSVYTLD